MSEAAPIQKTAAWRLFHLRYPMYISRIFMVSKEYVEKHGYYITGDVDLDRKRMGEPDLIRQTVAGIAMLHAEGCPVVLENKRDSVAIYKDLQEHLRDWERAAYDNIHPEDAPPISEFRQLEAIAIAVYPDAMFYQPRDRVGSDDLQDRLMAMSRSRNSVRVDKEVASRIRNEHGVLKPYVSVVDRIEKLLLEGRKTWQ